MKFKSRLRYVPTYESPQWICSLKVNTIKFQLQNTGKMSFDSYDFLLTHVETVALLSKLNTKDHLDIEIGEDELSEIDFSKEATYGEISQVHKVGVNSPSG